MTGKQLKNSILQWAIQGKLVPQDPNDEPASVLLEKIRQEKERLIKEKKIKRDKNASIIFRGEDNSYYEKFLATGEVKCIDEETPFPPLWYFKRYLLINTLHLPCSKYLLIIGIVLTTVDNGCVLVTFDFLLLDQAFFLLANLIKQNACWFGIMNSAVQVFPVSPIVICCSLIVFRSLFFTLRIC